VEGVEELEAVASSMAVETDEARSAVSLTDVCEDGLSDETGDADSPITRASQWDLSPLAIRLAGLWLSSERHWMGSAILRKVSADNNLSSHELFKTRATSCGWESLNNVRAVMTLGPKP